MFLQPGFIFFEMMRMSFGHDLEDGPVGGQRHILFESRETQARLPPDTAAGPAVRRQLAADDLQERRFPGPVASDDGHALARLDLKRNFIQERKMTESDGNTVQR